MTDRSHRPARPLALTLVGASAALAWVQVPALADTPAQVASCRAGGGVYIYTGSSTSGGCSHQMSSSLDALRSVAGVNFDGSGIICQIDDQPGTCPAKADVNSYWHYWWWSGGQWTYANLGPASHQPPAGSVEAWTFGGGAKPSWTPPAASVTASPSHRPAVPVPTSHATHTNEPAGPAPTASDTTVGPGVQPTLRSTTQHSPAQPSASASATAPAAGGASSATSTASAAPSASASASSTPTGSASPVGAPATSPVSHHQRPSGLLYGVILLVACGVGIAVSARRRRRP